MTIAYDGTSFHGWQTQPNGLSIQQLIEEALLRLIKIPVRIIAAGRTDAGVHALGQVAHFRTDKSLNTKTIFKALNGILPKDIRILEFAEAHPNFHANRSAIKKIYRYSICTESYVMPFEQRYTLHLHKKVDMDLVRQAAKLFIGKHDFTSFANVGGGAPIEKNPYRTILRLDVIPTPSGFQLEFEGDGFFYKMVRNITGMLLAVGTGRRELKDIKRVFHAKDRKQAERAVPANGLTLVKVFYPQDLINPVNDDDSSALPESSGS